MARRRPEALAQGPGRGHTPSLTPHSPGPNIPGARGQRPRQPLLCASSRKAERTRLRRHAAQFHNRFNGRSGIGNSCSWRTAHADRPSAYRRTTLRPAPGPLRSPPRPRCHRRSGHPPHSPGRYSRVRQKLLAEPRRHPHRRGRRTKRSGPIRHRAAATENGLRARISIPAPSGIIPRQCRQGLPPPSKTARSATCPFASCPPA